MTTELLDCTPSEQEWLEKCRRGDPKAQEMVFKAYYRFVFGICLRYLSSRELAQEVVNDCFLKLFYHLQTSNRHPDHFRSWLRRMAVHTAIDAYRKEKLRRHSTLDGASLEVGTPEGVSDALNAEEILRLLAQLPDLWRLTFNLYEVEGYTHDEIAQLLKIPVSSSRVYLTRAKQRLRELLGQPDSVKTFIPFYVTALATHPQDPDWNHLRETLRGYAPPGEPDAWEQFQLRQQQYPHGPQPGAGWKLYQQLVLLAGTAVICQTSQPLPATAPKVKTVIVSTQELEKPVAPVGENFAVNAPKLTHPRNGTTPATESEGDNLLRSTIKRNQIPSYSEVLAESSAAGGYPAEKHERHHPRVLPVTGDTPKNKKRLRQSLKNTVLPATGDITKTSDRIAATVASGRSEARTGFSPTGNAHATDALTAERLPEGITTGPRGQQNDPSYPTFRRHTAVRNTSRKGFTIPWDNSGSGGGLEKERRSSSPLKAERVERSLNRLAARAFVSRPIPLHAPVVKFAGKALSFPQIMRFRPLSFGVLAGVQVTQLPRQKPALGPVAGVWADKQVRRTLFMETGLTVAYAKTTQTANALMNQDTIRRMVSREQTDQWWSLGIPLSLRITIRESRAIGWWATAGFSSSLTVHEKRIRQINTSGTTPADTSQYGSPNTSWQPVSSNAARVLFQPFRWLTVSTGVRLGSTGKYEWWTESYYSYPLGGASFDGFRGSVVGLRMRIRRVP